MRACGQQSASSVSNTRHQTFTARVEPCLTDVETERFSEHGKQVPQVVSQAVQSGLFLVQVSRIDALSSVIGQQALDSPQPVVNPLRELQAELGL